MSTYEIQIFGKVQGVWYRKYVLQIASILNYTGYVKNLVDGSVEIIININTQIELESFISKLYVGSSFSNVTKVEYKKIDYVEFDDFTKRF